MLTFYNRDYALCWLNFVYDSGICHVVCSLICKRFTLQISGKVFVCSLLYIYIYIYIYLRIYIYIYILLALK